MLVRFMNKDQMTGKELQEQLNAFLKMFSELRLRSEEEKIF